MINYLLLLLTLYYVWLLWQWSPLYTAFVFLLFSVCITAQNADLPMARMMNSCYLIHKWVLVMVRKIRVMLLPVLQQKQLQQVWRRSMETGHSMQATHVSWHPQLVRRLLLHQRTKVGLISISSLQQVLPRNVVRTLHPKNSKMVQHHDNEKLCMNVQILSCVVAVYRPLSEIPLRHGGYVIFWSPLTCNNYFFQKGLCFDIHYCYDNLSKSQCQSSMFTFKNIRFSKLLMNT